MSEPDRGRKELNYSQKPFESLGEIQLKWCELATRQTQSLHCVCLPECWSPAGTTDLRGSRSDSSADLMHGEQFDEIFQVAKLYFIFLLNVFLKAYQLKGWKRFSSIGTLHDDRSASSSGLVQWWTRARWSQWTRMQMNFCKQLKSCLFYVWQST